MGSSEKDRALLLNRAASMLSINRLGSKQRELLTNVRHADAIAIVVVWAGGE